MRRWVISIAENKVTGQSLPFMADFFLTGGYGGICQGHQSWSLEILQLNVAWAR